MKVPVPHSAYPTGLSAPECLPELPCSGPNANPTPGVVIGLGNPMMRDDGVGLVALRRIASEMVFEQSVDCLALPYGGLCLLEALRGREWAVILDCLVTGYGPPGTVRQVSRRLRFLG